MARHFIALTNTVNSQCLFNKMCHWLTVGFKSGLCQQHANKGMSI